MMTIHQAFELLFKAARNAPLNGDTHDLLKEAGQLLAKYIVDGEKKNEPKAEVSSVHEEQRTNPHQSDV
jgi:hypothetical protein